MKFRILLEFDPETRRWSAAFPELPGCTSAGETEAETIANAREALELWFQPTDMELKPDSKLIEIFLR